MKTAKQFVGFGCLVASLLFLSVYSAKAQWHIGGEVGVTMSRLKVKSAGSVLGPTLGMTAEYTLPSRVVLQSGLSISQKGGSDIWNDPNYQPELFQLARIRNYYLELPLMVGYCFPVADRISIIPSAGGYVACGVGGYGAINNISSDTWHTHSYRWDNTFRHEWLTNGILERVPGFRRMDGGLRFGVTARVHDCSLRVAYDLGLAKTWRGFQKMHDFGFYNRNFSITIGYNFL